MMKTSFTSPWFLPLSFHCTCYLFSEGSVLCINAFVAKLGIIVRICSFLLHNQHSAEEAETERLSQSLLWESRHLYIYLLIAYDNVNFLIVCRKYCILVDWLIRSSFVAALFSRYFSLFFIFFFLLFHWLFTQIVSVSFYWIISDNKSPLFLVL